MINATILTLKDHDTLYGPRALVMTETHPNGKAVALTAVDTARDTTCIVLTPDEVEQLIKMLRDATPQ